MPKRDHEGTAEERWLKKKKKYERRLERERRKKEKRAHRQILSDEENSPQVEEQILTNENTENIPEPSAQDYGMYNYATTEHEINDLVLDSVVDDTIVAEPGPSTSNAPIEIDGNKSPDIYDKDLLREVENTEPELIEYGENLQPDVAASFQKILQSGIKEKTKEELLKKYSYPGNVTYAKGPTLNPEVRGMLVETCRVRDKRLNEKQDQLGKALSALGKALSDLLKKNPNIPEVIRTLNDAGKLIADSHYLETETRRSVIMPLIDKSLCDSLQERKRDTFLFGEKLDDVVKDSRSIKKTGQLMQATQPAKTTLNARGPSFRSVRQQRSGPVYQHRAGGPRMTQPYQYQYWSRRRAAAQPLQPLPAARRPPPPPPPPPPAPRRHQGPSQQRPPANR